MCRYMCVCVCIYALYHVLEFYMCYVDLATGEFIIYGSRLMGDILQTLQI